MKLTTSIYQVTFLIVLFAAFTGYTFMFASAPANPPANNADAPITVGAMSQIKIGGLGVDSLLVSGNMEVMGATSTFNQVRASEYCNKVGGNCFSAGAGLISLGVVRGETSGYTLTAQSICKSSGYDGVWAAMNVTGLEDIICFTSPFVGKLPEVQTFVSAYFALRSDPSFTAFWGSTLPNYDLTYCGSPITSLYRCGTGWQSFYSWSPQVKVGTAPNVYSANQIRTYDRICSYMMVNGKWRQGTALGVFDSGSDSGNNALYWNGSAMTRLSHDFNDYHDVRTLTCIGDSVTTQGNWWIKSSRPEAYDRSGNKYPVPPLR